MKLHLLILLSTIINIYTFAFTGDSTAYGGGYTGGACGFKQNSFNHNMMAVAIDNDQWDNSLNCGRCVSISYKNNINKTAIVVDKCPECKFGSLDLFLEAYSEIIHLPPGREIINWDFIPCPAEFLYSDITLRIDYINQYWLSINPENFKCGIKKMDIFMNNQWTALERDDNKMTGLYFNHNAFISMPFQIRITSIYNEVVITNPFDKLENLLLTNKQFSCIETNNSC